APRRRAPGHRTTRFRRPARRRRPATEPGRRPARGRSGGAGRVRSTQAWTHSAAHTGAGQVLGRPVFQPSRFRDIAVVTAAVRSDTPSLPNTRSRWVFTVASLM